MQRRSRDRHGGWMGGKQRIAAHADHLFDIGLGLRRRRLRARLPENLRREGGVLVGHAASRANSARAQASTLIAIFIAGMGESSLGRQLGDGFAA